MSAETAEICQFHGYGLDLVRRQLLDPAGVPVPLMPKAIETLVYLVLHAGQTVSKDELLRAVWPNAVVEENNLTQNISALRRAFGEKLGEHRFIVTIPGQGYRFVAPVSKVGRAAEPAPVQVEAQPPRWRWSVIGTVAIVVAVVGAAAWRLASMGEIQAPPYPQTIAILPFKPVVEERRNEAMELGMADSLIMELSRSPHLVVRPFSTTRRFAAVDQDPLAAGRQLAVEAVVDGTVQIADDRVRASARLLRVADGRQLWAGKFDEQFSNIFEVQDAIAQRVAGALQIQLGPSSQRQTENVRAYELYMLGRLHQLRLVMPEVRRGIEYFEQAIAEDKSYALAYAGIADAMRSLVLSNDAPPAEMAPRAKETASRAIELAPDLPEANYARGLVALWFDWDWQAAENYLSRAVVLAPNNAEAHIFLAHLYSNLGRKQEALTHARRARELNPISPLIGALEGMFLHAPGRARSRGPAPQGSRRPRSELLAFTPPARQCADRCRAVRSSTGGERRSEAAIAAANALRHVQRHRAGTPRPDGRSAGRSEVAGGDCAPDLRPALAPGADRDGAREPGSRLCVPRRRAVGPRRTPGAAEDRSEVERPAFRPAVSGRPAPDEPLTEPA